MKRCNGRVSADACGPRYQCAARRVDLTTRLAPRDLSRLAFGTIRVGDIYDEARRAATRESLRASRYAKLKAILRAHRVGAMVNNMERAIVLDVLPVLPEGVGADDPNHTFLLAVALACEADFIVTGDRRAGLLQRGSIGRARIVTPAALFAEAL